MSDGDARHGATGAATTPDKGEEGALAEGIDVRVYRRRWATLLVLCLALSATMLANTSLSVALPQLSRALGASTSAQQWFSDAYALVFAGLLFTTSSIADRYGRKWMLQAGMVLFGLVSVYVWLFVGSSTEMIAARALLGVGGAMIMPVTLSILTSVFPSGERTKAVGIWAAVSGAGSAAGPVIAGVLLQYFSWESVFVINVPVVVIGVIAGIRYIPSHTGTEGGHGGLDLLGALLSTAGITIAVYALIEAQYVGWLSPRTLSLVALGLVLLALFALWERRVADPMLDVRLFRSRGFSASAVALTLVFFAMIGVFFALSQTLQLVFGYSPLMASTAMLPMSVMMMLIAPQVSRIVDRFGPRDTISVGLLLAALGMVGLSTLTVDSGYWQILLPLSCTAAGMSLAMAPATDQLMANVPRERAGMGSATNDVTREVGASLGVAVLGSVLGGSYAARISDSLTGLPEQLRQTAEESLPGGMMVAESLGARGQRLADEVSVAWMNASQTAYLASAGLIAVAALVAWFFLPGKTRRTEVQTSSETERSVAEEPDSANEKSESVNENSGRATERSDTAVTEQ
ncbi:drug resistance transporter, EmrB/QacA subfamily [Actinopolyspora lacussalsi subsp. righensis]|uniref:Drug resistance transporter, EmrB/QacA subfamily n=1 Tax=Actinopolyspora righensis TaxID=995060 RepID=A0A1I6X362_9ACTN|nr:MFS transporter [Actinopolyspora righensis]SFT32657.1 drug resistance transporter, EmrB/QacA subfamily [Actinopolyspora righensis]